MAQATDTIPRSGIPLQNSALSLLTGTKARNGPTSFPGIKRQPSGSQTPSRLALRTPSRSIKPTVSPSAASAHSTPTVPTLRSISNSTAHQELDAGNKEVRKSISIASFPQPPGVNSRIPATPKISASVPHAMAESIPIRSSSNKATMQSVGESRLKRLRIAEDPPNNTHAISKTPPVLQNSSGSGKLAHTEINPQITNGPPSGQSPPISRSSSAQDSCSTSATTFEDTDETTRRSRNDHESVTNRPAKESKGNVIVSVRVRPDSSDNGDKKSEGEWMVDGRRSLVAYKGREGGQYFYGKSKIRDG